MSVLQFEVFPSRRLNVKEIPEGWDLAITCTATTLEPTLRLYEKLGPRHTPHIAAALVESEARARELSASLTERVFLVGGDSEAIGPFRRSAELIPYFRQCRELGVASYPEGHPSYPSEDLGDDILIEKQSLGATYTVTQMCFDQRKVTDWVTRIRTKGVTLPIYCGVVPPISAARLTEFALRCGVTNSLRFIRKMSARSIAQLTTRYDPDPLIKAVSPHVDGFHVYTFNAIETTRGWVENNGMLGAMH